MTPSAADPALVAAIQPWIDAYNYPSTTRSQ